MSSPRPYDEVERLKSLHNLRVLDAAREERFDRITRLACRVFDVPVSTIGFIDTNRLWFKSAHGFALREVSRDGSFCARTILGDEPLVVADAKADPHWAEFPTVIDERFMQRCRVATAEFSPRSRGAGPGERDLRIELRRVATPDR